MELFGLLFAVPVTLVTSLVYASLIIPVGRRWPVARLALLLCAGVVGVCVIVEAIFLGTFGAKSAYAHLRHLFTAIHFVNCFFGPPAAAHVAFYMIARVTNQAWLQFLTVVGCCWLACLSVIIGHIVIDEAIVGPEAGKPFYLTRQVGPNQAAANPASPSCWRTGCQWRGVAEAHSAVPP